jgi:uncharacterized protein YciI
LITFSAASLEEATQIIQRDPFMQAGLIDQNWIKEWLAELVVFLCRLIVMEETA